MLKKVAPHFLFYQVLNTYFHIGGEGHHGWLAEEPATRHRDAAAADYSPDQQAVGCNCNHFDRLEGGGM